MKLHLTNRWSQPLAVAVRRFDFIKEFSMFATLAAASGGRGNMIEEGPELSLGARQNPNKERNPSDAIRWHRLSQALQCALCDR